MPDMAAGRAFAVFGPSVSIINNPESTGCSPDKSTYLAVVCLKTGFGMDSLEWVVLQSFSEPRRPPRAPPPTSMAAKSSASELPFYHGKLSRDEAEHALNSNFRDGVHLVRVSTSSPGDYVLSLCASRQTLHFQIKHQGEVCSGACSPVAVGAVAVWVGGGFAGHGLVRGIYASRGWGEGWNSFSHLPPWCSRVSLPPPAVLVQHRRRSPL